MRKYLFILLALCFFFLCGCEKAPAGAVVLSNSQYRILELNGEYSLEFTADISAKDIQTGAATSAPSVHFTSLAEMVSTIEKGTFTASQLADIQQFAKSSNGKVAVCNMSALWEPVLPEGLSETKVIWYGQPYKIWFAGDGLDGEMNFTTKEAIDSYRATNTVTENEYIEFLSVTKDSERNAEEILYYSNATKWTSKIITYAYKDAAGRTVTVIERYYEFDENKSAPDIICGLIEGNGIYCHWSVGGFTERPSLEWIKSIGITPYVDTEAS